MNTIYTHDEAALIIERFENILSQYGIHVPSPEDDDRDEDDMVGDDTEDMICSIISRCKAGAEIVEGRFSGTI